MKARLALVAGLAGLAALAAPSGAAPAAPQVVDQAGDANAANGQGVADEELPGQSAPVSSADLDILGVTYSTTKTASGAVADLVVDLDLSGDVTTKSAIYRVTATYGDCGTLFIQYSVASDAKSASLRTCDPAGLQGTITTPITNFQTFEKKLRWTIPISLLSKLPVPIKVGTTLETLGAHTRLFLGAAGTGATVPQVDVAYSDASFKIA